MLNNKLYGICTVSIQFVVLSVYLIKVIIFISYYQQNRLVSDGNIHFNIV